MSYYLGFRHGWLRIGQRMIVALPDADRDIGTVAPEDQIVVSRKPGAAGFVYDIDVKRSA